MIEIQQLEIYKQLNKNRKQNKKKSRRGKEDLSFSDVMDPMSHDSYKRCKGGAIK
ncbi:hypothetical protein EXN65_14605 [Clostridium botulinum]|uniref:Uncharacterized protein n=1 Tax=Clostridium botulinum TaxID=1491 RepID=A0A846I1Z9_CLOBO|nr:hypothetical protein RSJ19_12940 [Clostridium botulinum]AXG94062.1 hypothetical protein AGE29_01780 [Clostridium botulinum]MBN3397495.1 hypothetical protein [Clostridium botulinum]MBN3412737.1 hypothetical protein [Clostridium botulinum]NEZ85932.1 hypothetical protein [Clostridium botulinum]